VALVEVAGCIFDAEQLALGHGYEGLDPVGREAFVNHLHLTFGDRVAAAEQIIASCVAEMKARWPGRVFRIYRDLKSDGMIIRFHMARRGRPNWCDEGIEIIVVGTE
jgi:hypothetical protein